MEGLSCFSLHDEWIEELPNVPNDNSARHYWFESGTMTSLIEHLRQFSLVSALECDGIEVGENEFNIPCESAESPIPLLYQSGYLTIDTCDALLRTYTLHFTNLEVREGMISGLITRIQNDELNTNYTNLHEYKNKSKN